MNYSKIKHFDIANGTGIRTSLFVSGCDKHCKGCFNQETWDFNSGKEFNDDVLEELLNSCDYEQCAGLSILGGEPLNIKNISTVSKIILEFRKRFGNKKTIWLWTGYTVEELVSNKLIELDLKFIFMNIDFLIDGPFIEEKKDLNLDFRGSSNQRVFDMTIYR